jgi:ABC-type nitrate/sulfonate/bicarbonate transport system substrate-binding protein
VINPPVIAKEDRMRRIAGSSRRRVDPMGASILALAVLMGVALPAHVVPSRAADAPLPVAIAYQADLAWNQFGARALGLFDKVGLAPKHVKFLAGAPMIAAAQGGSIDIGAPGIVPFITGVGQGIDWVIIGVDAAGASSEGLLVRNDARISSIADLNGKKIGYFRASTAHYAVVTALWKHGINPNKVQLLHMAPAQQFAAMTNKDIDATWVWEPWMQKMVHQANAKILTTEKNEGIYTAAGILAVRRDWLASHRETVRRFLTALLLAQDALDKDRTPALKVVSEEFGIPPEWALVSYSADPPEMRRWLDPAYPFSIGKDGLLRKNLDEVARFLLEEKVIAKPVDTRNLIDTSILEEVLKASGK